MVLAETFDAGFLVLSTDGEKLLARRERDCGYGLTVVNKTRLDMC